MSTTFTTCFASLISLGQRKRKALETTVHPYSKQLMGRRPRRPRKRKAPSHDNFLSKDEMYNETYVAYFVGQGVIREDEVDAFVAALRAPLPGSLRVTPGRSLTPV